MCVGVWWVCVVCVWGCVARECRLSWCCPGPQAGDLHPATTGSVLRPGLPQGPCCRGFWQTPCTWHRKCLFLARKEFSMGGGIDMNRMLFDVFQSDFLLFSLRHVNVECQSAFPCSLRISSSWSRLGIPTR